MKLNLSKKNLILLAITVLLAAAVAVLVFAVAQKGVISEDDQSNSSSDSGAGNKLSGGSTSLSGSVSQRNIEGLSLRINQIETCSPGVVSAYVAVSSDEGNVNTNFGRRDVKVYLDGREIDDFEFEPVDTVKLPLTNVLAIDRSGSMVGDAMVNAKSAAEHYVNNLQRGDQVGLIQFDTEINVMRSITQDKQAVVESIRQIEPRSDTALYDAIARGIDMVPDCGRQAVTVLTDGNDTVSRKHTKKSVIDAANQKNIPVFSVGIKGDAFNPQPMKDISSSTGGQYLEANTPSEVKDLYSKIDSQLTGQFVANIRLPIDKQNKSYTLRIVSDVGGSQTSGERDFVY